MYVFTSKAYKVCGLGLEWVTLLTGELCKLSVTSWCVARLTMQYRVSRAKTRLGAGGPYTPC